MESKETRGLKMTSKDRMVSLKLKKDIYLINNILGKMLGK